MTLTFDPLALNFCNISGFVCLNFVQKLSEIKQSVPELLTI